MIPGACPNETSGSGLLPDAASLGRKLKEGKGSGNSAAPLLFCVNVKHVKNVEKAQSPENSRREVGRLCWKV